MKHLLGKRDIPVLGSMSKHGRRSAFLTDRSATCSELSQSRANLTR
jgi:hypothetical protein